LIEKEHSGMEILASYRTAETFVQNDCARLI